MPRRSARRVGPVNGSSLAESAPSPPQFDDPESVSDLYLAAYVLVNIEGQWMPAQHAVAQLGAIHVLTAWNPGLERPGSAANHAANEALRQLLESEGCNPIPALGGDPNSDHTEESWCVTGLSDSRAREIGARFGQWAVFRITSSAQTVLGCHGEWERSRAV